MSVDCVSAGLGYPCGVDVVGVIPYSYLFLVLFAILGGIIVFLYLGWLSKKGKVWG